VCECVCAWRRCDCSFECQVVDNRRCSNHASFACESVQAVRRIRCDDSRIVSIDGYMLTRECCECSECCMSCEFVLTICGRLGNMLVLMEQVK
jgi:hypothetical protein